MTKHIAVAALALLVISSQAQNITTIDSTLREVYKKDQAIRVELIPELQSGDSERFLIAYAKMNQVDSVNQKYVFELLENHSWPDGISDSASRAIFLVVDHSDLVSQQKYLPLVKQAALNGKVDQSEWATLQDRVLMGLDKPQIFGTQTKFFLVDGQSSPVYIWPIEDYGNVNERRRQIGLSTIEEYLELLSNQGFKAVWEKSLTVEDLLKRYNIVN